MARPITTLAIATAMLLAAPQVASALDRVQPENRVRGQTELDHVGVGAQRELSPGRHRGKADAGTTIASGCLRAPEVAGAVGEAGATAERSLVQANRAAGNAFRDEIADLLAAEGRGVATEVYKPTPFGRRFIDIEVSQGGKVLGGIETKLGGSRYLPSQRAKDMYLWLRWGYRVNVVRGP